MSNSRFTEQAKAIREFLQSPEYDLSMREQARDELIAEQFSYHLETMRIWYNGREFVPSEGQFKIIMHMVDLFIKCELPVSQEQLRKVYAFSDLRHLFRNSDLWGTLITSPRKGWFKLNIREWFNE